MAIMGAIILMGLSIPDDSEPSIPEAQYRDSALMDTAILSIEYRDSGQRIPIFFIMYPYALKRKYITKEVIVYDQVSRDHPAIRIRS